MSQRRILAGRAITCPTPTHGYKIIL